MSRRQAYSGKKGIFGQVRRQYNNRVQATSSKKKESHMWAGKAAIQSSCPGEQFTEEGTAYLDR